MFEHVGRQSNLENYLNNLQNLKLSKEYKVLYTTDKQFGLYHHDFMESGENNGLFTQKQLDNQIIIG